MPYANTIELGLDYDDAVVKVKAAFKDKGFGTLTEIDVRATLREKLGEEVAPYLIIGACNPALAHRALGADPQVGTLLPCNVVVRSGGPGRTIVVALNPLIMVELSDSPGLRSVAEEAGRLTGDALAALAAADPVPPAS